MEKIEWLKNERARKNVEKTSVDFLSMDEIKKVKKFHESFEAYSVTPLARLKNLASRLNVSEILVKDESYRFGLNAFKVLGGSYAVGKYLETLIGESIEDLSFDKLKSEEVRNKIGNITFTTATDGNHGRGVAWSAQQLGQKAVIYMPKGSSQIRVDNIKATGAEVYVTDVNYDDTVRISFDAAKENGWVIVQDTAWKGYTDIPTWIMQGYATLLLEALEQIVQIGVEKPTHVFVQAGVGSLAGAIQGLLVAIFKEEAPKVVVVEAEEANCIFRSAQVGEIRNVEGDLNTIMAGLACGEPNPIGWNILRDYTDVFVSCPNDVAARGMRVLANPLKGDEKVISGESGAVTMGLLFTILEDEGYKSIKESMGIDENSKILLINTEGNTDPEHYRKIVWDGYYPNI